MSIHIKCDYPSTGEWATISAGITSAVLQATDRGDTVGFVVLDPRLTNKN